MFLKWYRIMPKEFKMEECQLQEEKLVQIDQ